MDYGMVGQHWLSTLMSLEALATYREMMMDWENMTHGPMKSYSLDNYLL